MTTLNEIRRRIRYRGPDPGGWPSFRFTVAVRPRAAPAGHKLHGRDAVRYRRLDPDGMLSCERLCTVVALVEWVGDGDVDQKATNVCP